MASNGQVNRRGKGRIQVKEMVKELGLEELMVEPAWRWEGDQKILVGLKPKISAKKARARGSKEVAE